MRNVMDKEIRENDAIATIEFEEGLSEDIIKEVDSILSKNYDQVSRYIMKVNKNLYKGDMACLSSHSFDIVDELNNKKLNKTIKKYLLFNPDTNEEEDFLEDLVNEQ